MGEGSADTLTLLQTFGCQKRTSHSAPMNCDQPGTQQGWHVVCRWTKVAATHTGVAATHTVVAATHTGVAATHTGVAATHTRGSCYTYKG